MALFFSSPAVKVRKSAGGMTEMGANGPDSVRLQMNWYNKALYRFAKMRLKLTKNGIFKTIDRQYKQWFDPAPRKMSFDGTKWKTYSLSS